VDSRNWSRSRATLADGPSSWVTRVSSARSFTSDGSPGYEKAPSFTTRATSNVGQVSPSYLPLAEPTNEVVPDAFTPCIEPAYARGTSESSGPSSLAGDENRTSADHPSPAGTSDPSRATGKSLMVVDVRVNVRPPVAVSYARSASETQRVSTR
jgi:hypothetical protein